MVEGTIKYGNGDTTTLSLYVFTQRNFVADFIPSKLTFIFLNEKIAFELHFGGLTGNVYALRL